MPSSQFDIEAVRFWLGHLHGDSEGWIHVCSTGDWTGKGFFLDDPKWHDEATAYVASLDAAKREGIYLRVTTIKANITDGRGKDSDSLSFPGLWADIDIAGPGHKTDKPLPVDEDQAQRIVTEAGLPEPTLWVASGGGFYPYWLLRHPINIRDAEHLSALQELSAGWQRCLGEAAERLGLHYGTQVGDLSRVLRIPGTVNRKAGMERPCEVISGAGPSYDLEELILAFGHASTLLKAADNYEAIPHAAVARHGDSPLDQFEAATEWDDPDLLTGAGWQFHHRAGNTSFWTRPGKRRIDGTSATTGRSNDRDRMYNFSDGDSLIPAGGPYTKGYVYALLHHGGDLKAAVKALASKGFGKPASTPTPAPDSFWFTDPDGQQDEQRYEPPDLSWQTQDDWGNGERMSVLFGDVFKYVTDARKWAHFNGKHWVLLSNPDTVKRHAAKMAEIVALQAKQLLDAGDDRGESLAKWAKVSKSNARTDASVANFRAQADTSVEASVFDQEARYVGVRNGVLDLGEPGDLPKLLPPHPKYMITKTMNCSYNPGASSRSWDKFIEEVLPDPDLRGYLQRLSGYALRGKPNRRAMAIISGPPRSGKSKFIESMGNVFGQYAATADASLLRQKRDGSSPTVDLHHLRGRRFVATSEASESTVMDEELVKRITGMDKINSRGLYELPQEWMPQFVMFMATNHHPKVNPEDAATWDRLKVIRFEQEFRGDNDDPDLLSKLVAESDAILNWLLAGMLAFQSELALKEPESVVQAGDMYRHENDTVSQFINSSVEDGNLLRVPDVEIKHLALYSQYEGWCQLNKLGPPLGPRKFSKRMESLGFGRNGPHVWIGLQQPAHGWLGGGYRS